MAALPPRSGLAGCKASIAGRLLLGRQRGLPLSLLGGLTDPLSLLALQLGKRLSFSLRPSFLTGHLAFVLAHLAGLDDRAASGLPGEHNRVVGSGTSPEPGYRGLSRLRSGLETIDKLIGFELAHVRSLCPPRLCADGEKKMKPPRTERLRSISGEV
ncbi:hypothetical protein LDDCCGHA_1307 [Methylobacterium oxalidis]|nr:hypothetical protein LDDCCGHA_1307 [Methylobacterium oxalidis]